MFAILLKPRAGRGRPRSKVGAGATCSIVLAAVFLSFAAARKLPSATVSFDIVSPQPDQESFKNLWSITMRNSTAKSCSVSFRVEAREAEVGSVFSASTPPVELAPGERRITAADIKLTDVSCKKGYEAFIRSKKVLPAGDYTYLVTLAPKMTQRVFFFRVRVPKRIRLAWPPNGSAVGDTQPVLAWDPPELSGPFVDFNYALRVVEVQRGQNGLAAVRGNPSVFESHQVPTTALRMPAGSTLVAGRTYAWRVAVVDTAGTPKDTTRTQSLAGTFVYKPGPNQTEALTNFTYPRAGRSVTGNASFVVASDLPDAELCIGEYLLGSDSTGRDWQVIGPFRRDRGFFVGAWASDSAVIRAGQTFPSPCIVRATVLGSKGQRGEPALLSLVVNEPPPADRRGCGGCNQIPDE